MTSEEVWKCVYYINSYHVGWSVEQGRLKTEIARKYMGDHRPASTGVGVERLAYDGCLVEIAVFAALPQ
jgi:enamine deaminase RidA (YjgF/YER057c/UK114 family)